MQDEEIEYFIYMQIQEEEKKKRQALESLQEDYKERLIEQEKQKSRGQEKTQPFIFMQKTTVVVYRSCNNYSNGYAGP